MIRHRDKSGGRVVAAARIPAYAVGVTALRTLRSLLFFLLAIVVIAGTVPAYSAASPSHGHHAAASAHHGHQSPSGAAKRHPDSLPCQLACWAPCVQLTVVDAQAPLAAPAGRAESLASLDPGEPEALRARPPKPPPRHVLPSTHHA